MAFELYLVYDAEHKLYHLRMDLSAKVRIRGLGKKIRKLFVGTRLGVLYLGLYIFRSEFFHPFKDIWAYRFCRSDGKTEHLIYSIRYPVNGYHAEEKAPYMQLSKKYRPETYAGKNYGYGIFLEGRSFARLVQQYETKA